MPIYFIVDDYDGPIKIGISKNVDKRLSTLQTGNPRELKLMAWIVTQGKSEDHETEQKLHRFFSEYRVRGEWFSLTPDHILEVLTSYFYYTGFLALNKESLKVIDTDQDGIPMVGEVWDWHKWGIFRIDWDQCCPYCGCVCGLHYEEQVMLHECLYCGYHDLVDIYGPDTDPSDFENNSPSPKWCDLNPDNQEIPF